MFLALLKRPSRFHFMASGCEPRGGLGIRSGSGVGSGAFVVLVFRGRVKVHYFKESYLNISVFSLLFG